MKQTINEYDFTEAFRRIGRMTTTENPNGNFSYTALRYLFEYLEDYEKGTREEMELDPIAICCNFAEYASAREAALEMSDWKPDPDLDDEQNEDAALARLQDDTTVIPYSGGVIVQSF